MFRMKAGAPSAGRVSSVGSVSEPLFISVHQRVCRQRPVWDLWAIVQFSKSALRSSRSDPHVHNWSLPESSFADA